MTPRRLKRHSNSQMIVMLIIIVSSAISCKNYHIPRIPLSSILSIWRGNRTGDATKPATDKPQVNAKYPPVTDSSGIPERAVSHFQYLNGDSNLSTMSGGDRCSESRYVYRKRCWLQEGSLDMAVVWRPDAPDKRGSPISAGLEDC
jgi:hypothetical protein